MTWTVFFLLYYGIFCPSAIGALLWAIDEGWLDGFLGLDGGDQR